MSIKLLLTVTPECKHVLKIKETLFWRADSTGGCAAVISLSAELLRQARLIEGMLYDLEEDNVNSALSKPEWYEENVVIPEDDREVEMVRESVDQEEGRKLLVAEDEVEKLLVFEEYFYKYKKRLLFSEVVGPGS